MEILTANELISGAVVYLAQSGRWQPDINKARVFNAGEAAVRDKIIADASAADRLIGIETEKVTVTGGAVVAVRLRERIRAAGPTAPYGPERQHIEEDGHVSL